MIKNIINNYCKLWQSYKTIPAKPPEGAIHMIAVEAGHIHNTEYPQQNRIQSQPSAYQVGVDDIAIPGSQMGNPFFSVAVFCSSCTPTTLEC